MCVCITIIKGIYEYLVSCLNECFHTVTYNNLMNKLTRHLYLLYSIYLMLEQKNHVFIFLKFSEVTTPYKVMLLYSGDSCLKNLSFKDHPFFFLHKGYYL